MDPYLPPEDQDLDNPYAPPRSAFVRAAAPRPFGGIPFTVNDVFNWSWSLYKERMGACMAIFWGVVGVNWALSFAMQMVLTGLMAVVQEPALFMVLNFLIALLGIVVQVWLGIGMNLGLLKIARREPVSFDVVFTGGRSVVTVFLSAIIVGVIVGAPVVFILSLGLVGMFAMMQRLESVMVLILFVLGCGFALVWLLYLIARLMQFYYLAIDRNLGVFESIQRSWALTKSRAATIILVFLLQMVLGIAGVLACCVGLIFALPLSSMLSVVTYLALTEPAKTVAKAGPEGWDEELFIYPDGR